MPQQNRIDARFAQLRLQKRKAFVAYITAGDPHLRATEKLVWAMEKIGVDVLELGVPFSDPLADGVVNQLAADRGLKSGTTLNQILKSIARMRKKGLRMPLVLFTYFNPIHRYGVKKFVSDAARAGVDGVLNLDLPPEEADGFTKLMTAKDVHPIYLIAPTTPRNRIRSVVKNARGFVYYVSREGVTGMQRRVAGGIVKRVDEIHRFTRTPVVVGFGISTPQQVKAISKTAEGCVVGSAIVDRIGKIGKSSRLVPEISRFVSGLIRPLKSK
jgi:tryptophan synthase alpha chain